MRIRALGLLMAIFLVPFLAFAQTTCVTIQSGTILDSNGNVVTTGFDRWGYNYQAHIFNGLYANYDRPTVPYTAATCSQRTDLAPWSCDQLQMKWNDAWLSNQDCNGDHKLDRHFGFGTYVGSGAWLTNHELTKYTDGNGATQSIEYFVKIVAAPANATPCGGFWCNPDGTQIGYALWGEFAVILESSTDTAGPGGPLIYHSPLKSGFGAYGPSH